MGTPAQIGKSEYNAALVKARNANADVRQVLKRLMQESHSPLVKALVGQIAIHVGENDEAIFRLDEIGRKSKEL